MFKERRHERRSHRHVLTAPCRWLLLARFEGRPQGFFGVAIYIFKMKTVYIAPSYTVQYTPSLPIMVPLGVFPVSTRDMAPAGSPAHEQHAERNEYSKTHHGHKEVKGPGCLGIVLVWGRELRIRFHNENHGFYVHRIDATWFREALVSA